MGVCEFNDALKSVFLIQADEERAFLRHSSMATRAGHGSDRRGWEKWMRGLNDG